MDLVSTTVSPPLVKIRNQAMVVAIRDKVTGRGRATANPLARDLVRVTAPSMEEIRDKAMKTSRNKNTVMFGQNHPPMKMLHDKVPAITRDRAMLRTTNRVMEAIQFKVMVRVLDQAMVSL